ncbi:unnamed protein product [Sphagnum jensenii]|uniref:Uncharacterized protein n=1 Tax=Sphagnum jensenii TaxID=128206 RepID=A0ABP1A0F5_9BRYO
MASGATAQTKAATGGYCLMRVFDVNKYAASGGGFIGAKIIITYETGEQEIVELEAYNEKTEPENLKKIGTTLNELKQKGYMLMSASSTGEQGNIVTDYVLLKQAY